MVWDGAAKVHGQSLNSNLLVGPDLLVPLPDVLMRFRQRKIGITGDIKEMFHQILFQQADQDSQRFLWRDGNSSVEPDTYIMKVMTFGSSCSPSTAQFVKNKNAMDFKDTHPRAVEAVTRSHYVDDLIDCTHTPEEAIKLISDVQFIHQHAGFELRGFHSNSPEVLGALANGTQDGTKMLEDKVNFAMERVLGMYWHTADDTFTYCLKFVKFNPHTDNFAPTKREILSTVMSVFDPLGFLAHFVVYAKIVLQEVWRCKTGWDDALPPILRNKWIQWLDDLPKVERVHVPRLYSDRMSPSPPTSIPLHLFVDASLDAFAAVAYFRIENESGVDSCLVMAKTRVAPIKPMTVPRLELQGAVLGTRLADSVIKSHDGLRIDKTIIWCDSRTVLSWLTSDLRKYNQFVTFRVAEILDSPVNIEWRWIPSEENVADDATKSKIVNLDMSTRWFTGPEFLRDPDSDWTFELNPTAFETTEELRQSYVLSHMVVPIHDFIDFTRFSKWQRLVCTMAYVRRFVHNSRATFDVRCFGVFSSEELMMAEVCLYKKIQYDSFQDELVIVRFNDTAPISKQKEFPKTSHIRLCSAYMDDYGVMRMRGRLDAAAITDTVKRPIILSRHHYVTHLIVDFYHHKYKHQHHQTVLNEVNQKYWIPALRVLLGVIRNRCQKCKNTAAVPRVPEMASLPKARLAVYTRPFTYVGIDYFGPILVVFGRGTAKRWGVLITCFTTRAIHLEIAHSLDTSSCIMAINNFVCFRGQPREFYSDNGTNFHGADNVLRQELENEFAKLDKDRIQEEFTTSEYSWTFNPPAAPHMGGVWERMIQSVKKCLDESMTARYPTDEVLKSLFAEAENIVNSRPLTYVALDSPDDEVLTPNHFLIGSSSGRKPAGDFGDVDLMRNNWRTAQAMADKFWDAFVVEYLPTIMKRTKWTKKVEPLRVDDVVLIVDDNFKRNTWPKGIIVEVFKDKSQHVRSARVRTSLGTFLTRPVSKLVVLEVRRDLDNQEFVKLRSTGSVNGVENVTNRALDSNF